MKNKIRTILLSLSLVAASSVSALAVAAPPMMDKDPARWYVEDTTPQARAATLRKEAGAALQEAKKECSRSGAGNRSACMKEAMAIYQSDMADANRVSRR